MQEIATNFGALPAFLTGLDDNNIGDATTKTMIQILTEKKAALELELAAVNVATCRDMSRHRDFSLRRDMSSTFFASSTW